MSSVLLIENSHPFSRVLLPALALLPGLKIERAFSAVNAVNKMKERRYDLILICGKDPQNQKVQDALKNSGASFLSVDMVRRRPIKDREGVLQNAVLVMEDLHNSAEYTLSGFKNEKDLFNDAAGHVVRYISEHFESQTVNARNLELYSVLEGARMGVAVISGRKLEKVNRHLADSSGMHRGRYMRWNFLTFFLPRKITGNLHGQCPMIKMQPGGIVPPTLWSPGTVPGWNARSWSGAWTGLTR